jgi:hypothetical protein
MILSGTDATFSWLRGYKVMGVQENARMRLQEQQWDFQADGSGRRRLLVEGGSTTVSHIGE